MNGPRPGGKFGFDLAGERNVQIMPGFVRSQATDDRRAQKGKVSDKIEHFVQGKFIRIAQTIIIEQAISVHDNGIVQRSTERQPAGPQFSDVCEPAKSPRRRKARVNCNGIV